MEGSVLMESGNKIGGKGVLKGSEKRLFTGYLRILEQILLTYDSDVVSSTVDSERKAGGSEQHDRQQEAVSNTTDSGRREREREQATQQTMQIHALLWSASTQRKKWL